MTTRASSSSAIQGGTGTRVVTFSASNGGKGALTRVDPHARQVLAGFIGHVPSDQEVRALVGARADAQVTVERHGVTAVVFELRGPRVPKGHRVARDGLKLIYGGIIGTEPARRILDENSDGTRVMHNEILGVHPDFQRQGIGLGMFAREVKALSALRNPDGSQRIARIETFMAGSPGSTQYTGARVWPLMGYDTNPGDLKLWRERQLQPDSGITAEQRAVIERFAPDGTVLDLYEQPGGRDVWAARGEGYGGYFDLRPNSRSMRILREYVKRKGYDWEAL